MNHDKALIFPTEKLQLEANQAEVGDEVSYKIFPDGVLIVNPALAEFICPAKESLSQLPANTSEPHYPNSLIAPDFFDCQFYNLPSEIITIGDKKSLEWKETYTFSPNIFPVGLSVKGSHSALI